MRHDSLGRVAGDLFACVQLFRDAPDASRPSESDLRRQILGLLDQVSAAPTSHSLDPAEVEAARFALAAWTDETVLTSNWSGAESWHHDLLQNSLFGTNRGGDEFYERLDALPPNFNQAREVFFLCLIMGFEGRHAGNDAARHELTRKLYETLRVAGLAKDVASERHLTEPAYNLEIEVHGGSGRGLFPVIATWFLATALGLGLLYAALWLLAGGVEIPPEI